MSGYAKPWLCITVFASGYFGRGGEAGKVLAELEVVAECLYDGVFQELFEVVWCAGIGGDDDFLDAFVPEVKGVAQCFFGVGEHAVELEAGIIG